MSKRENWQAAIKRGLSLILIALHVSYMQPGPAASAEPTRSSYLAQYITSPASSDLGTGYTSPFDTLLKGGELGEDEIYEEELVSAIITAPTGPLLISDELLGRFQPWQRSGVRELWDGLQQEQWEAYRAAWPDGLPEQLYTRVVHIAPTLSITLPLRGLKSPLLALIALANA